MSIQLSVLVAPVAFETVVELLFPRREILGQRLEHPRALVKRHGAQRRTADRRARTEAHPEIDPLRTRFRDLVSPVTALNRSVPATDAFDPLAVHVVLEPHASRLTNDCSSIALFAARATSHRRRPPALLSLRRRLAQRLAGHEPGVQPAGKRLV